MADLDNVLKERGREYGSFDGHASITQQLERIIMGGMDAKLHAMDNQMTASTIREGVHMIAHKLARLANGNPLFLDSWHDIAGYATITANMIEKHASETSPTEKNS